MIPSIDYYALGKVKEEGISVAQKVKDRAVAINEKVL